MLELEVAEPIRKGELVYADDENKVRAARKNEIVDVPFGQATEDLEAGDRVVYQLGIGMVKVAR